MSKASKMKKHKNGKWSAYDEIRHPMPKPGFTFKDKKRRLKDLEDAEDMRDWRSE